MLCETHAAFDMREAARRVVHTRVGRPAVPAAPRGLQGEHGVPLQRSSKTAGLIVAKRSDVAAMETAPRVIPKS